MIHKLFRAAFLIGLAVVVSTAYGQQWQFVGARAMGMGGAGVATAYGPDAQYWNPAGLAQEEDTNETGLLLDGAASLQATHKTLEGVRDLSKMADQYKRLQNTLNTNQEATAENISTLFKGLDSISKMLGNEVGALVNANGGMGLKIKNFAVSARALATGSVLPVVDTKNIQFNAGSVMLGAITTPATAAQISAAAELKKAIDNNGVFDALNSLLGNTFTNSGDMANAFVNAAYDRGATDAQILEAIGVASSSMSGATTIIKQAAGATGNYKNNETLAMADAATFAEVGLGYGTKVIQGLKLGANLKVIDGYTAQSGVMIIQDDEKISKILDKAYDNKKSSVNIGIDLGAQANLSQLLDKEIFLNPQFGLTVRNLNNPKFDRPTAPDDMNPAIKKNWNNSKYELKPQVRAGAAVNPFKFMTLAADIDVTENNTMLSSIKSRQLALGMEINVLNRPTFNIPVRVGYNKDLSAGELAPYYTAGIGFNMAHFYLELAGAMSTKSCKIDDKDIPNSAAASLTLGFLF